MCWDDEKGLGFDHAADADGKLLAIQDAEREADQDVGMVAMAMATSSSSAGVASASSDDADSADMTFFRLADTGKAFSQLTLIGDKSLMKNVDFLAQPYDVVAIEHSADSHGTPSGAVMVPSSAALSEPCLV